MPGVEQHGVEGVQAQELDHNKGNGEDDVADGQGDQQRVHPD